MPSQFEKLKKLASNENPHMRAWAVRKLRVLYPEEAGEEFFLNALQDDHPEV